MREPAFWREKDLRARASAPLTRALLSPVAALYRWAGANRLAKAQPYDPGVPVICIGNLTLGGAGKTPVVAALRAHLSTPNRRVASLSRGYGGALKHATRVDPSAHTAKDVGDEPLMLAQSGESWIGVDRASAARAMAEDGVALILMDDGHQNPALKKALSIIVVDAGDPFGNGLVFPKGPLRETPETGLLRADAVVMMGDGAVPAVIDKSGLPILRGRLAPTTPAAPGRYVAFAGIGRPQKFFGALGLEPGLELVETIPFPDHHVYSGRDLAYLETLAAEREAQLITTEKDYVRLLSDARSAILSFTVGCVFDDPAALEAVLDHVR